MVKRREQIDQLKAIAAQWTDTFWQHCPGAALTVMERGFLRRTATEQMIVYNTPVIGIINIGVMWGASMHCFRAGAPMAALVGIDIDFKTYPIKNPGMLGAMLVQGDSTKIHATRGKDMKNIHILFIDGSHLYKDVKADIAGWAPKVAQGGIMLFHDYNPKPVDMKRDPTLAGVRKAVNEWFAVSDNNWKWLMAPDSLRAFRRMR